MLPKSGNRFPYLPLPSEADYSRSIATALRSELGDTRGAAKTLMRWTGVSNRTARNWIGGAVGPSGLHLVCLARQSDAVLGAFLELSQRRDIHLATDIHAVEVALAKASNALEILKRQTTLR